MHLERTADTAYIVRYIVPDLLWKLLLRKYLLLQRIVSIWTTVKRKKTYIVKNETSAGSQHAEYFLKNMRLSRKWEEVYHAVGEHAIDRVGVNGQGLDERTLHKGNMRRP